MILMLYLIRGGGGSTTWTGGIYVDSSDSKVIVLPDWQSATYTICFMQPLIDSVNISLTFMNNTSVNGGDNVYGGFLYPCLMLGFYHDPVDVINIYFHFDHKLF